MQTSGVPPSDPGRYVLQKTPPGFRREDTHALTRQRRGVQSVLGSRRIDFAVLLIVVLMVAALALPAIQATREASRRTECENNLRFIAAGLRWYSDTCKVFPYGCIGNNKLPPEKRWSWYCFIADFTYPYGEPLIDITKPWDAPDLRPLKLRTALRSPDDQAKEVPLYPIPYIRCPNGPNLSHSDGQPYTTYVGMAGVGDDAPTLPSGHPRAGVWAYERQTRTSALAGISQTILLIETAHENGCWLAGAKSTVRGADNGISAIPPLAGLRRAGQFGGLHPGGCQAAFVDAHVNVINENIDPTVFQSLCTPSWQ